MITLSMGPVLCLAGTSGSPKVGTNGSLSMVTVLCPCGSVLMVLCPCWSMMSVLCPIGWEDNAQAPWEEAMGSMQWGGKGAWARQSLARLAAVSEAAQKVGEELVHPMVKDRGTAMS